MEKLSNPQKTIETIKKYQFNFQKKFGQNFLIDEHVISKIINGAGVTKDDFVLELSLIHISLIFSTIWRIIFGPTV